VATRLHPQMPVEQFLKMNRGIDQGADLPEPFLRVGPLVEFLTCHTRHRPTLTRFSPSASIHSPPQELYEGIRDNEFTIPDEEKGKLEIFVDSEFKGWLRKEGWSPAAKNAFQATTKKECQKFFFRTNYESSALLIISPSSRAGGRKKSWHRRWFILSNSCLYYFESPDDKTPKGR
jgi:cytohesin